MTQSTTGSIEIVSYAAAVDLIEDVITSQPGQTREEMVMSEDPAGDYQALAATLGQQGETLLFTESQYVRYIEEERQMLDMPKASEMTTQDKVGTDYPEMRRVTAAQGSIEFGFTQEIDLLIGDVSMSVYLHENGLLTIRVRPAAGQTVGLDLFGVRPREIDLAGLKYHRASSGV